MEEQKDVSAPETAADRYIRLATDRETYLTRARRCSELTIPSLIPPDGWRGGDLPEPFQSVGARGVNNLAAKLTLALFPPGTSFVRLSVDTIVLGELEAQAREGGLEVESIRAEFEEALSVVERAVINRMEQRGIRTTMDEVLKHLLVGGNALLHVLKDGSVRMHPMSTYVVKRDYEGNVLSIIIKETVAKKVLPDEVQEFLEAHPDATSENTEGREDEVDLYTVVDRVGKKWMIHQEAGGMVIPKSRGWEPLDKPSFRALRLRKIDGEDWGRGFVEEYKGDLGSYEDLSQAIVEWSAAASRLLLFVNDTGLTNKEEVARAASGSTLDGRAEDVSLLSLAEKSPDFKVTFETAQEIKSRLEQSFLLFSSIQRNGERVTAEEIRTLANELEQGLGGIYSILAQELQMPLFERIMWQMQKAGDLPALPSKAIAPQVVGGIEGLGRSSDLTKLDNFLTGVGAIVGPEALAEYINVGVYATLRAAALGIDTKGLIRSEEEVQQARQQKAQAEMIQKLGPTAIKVGSEQMAAAQAPSTAA